MGSFIQTYACTMTRRVAEGQPLDKDMVRGEWHREAKAPLPALGQAKYGSNARLLCPGTGRTPCYQHQLLCLRVGATQAPPAPFMKLDSSPCVSATYSVCACLSLNLS